MGEGSGIGNGNGSGSPGSSPPPPPVPVPIGDGKGSGNKPVPPVPVPSGDGRGNGSVSGRLGSGSAGSEGSGRAGSEGNGSDGRVPPLVPDPLLLEPVPGMGKGGRPGSDGSNDNRLAGFGKPGTLGKSGRFGKPGDCGDFVLVAEGLVVAEGLSAAGGIAGAVELDGFLPPEDGEGADFGDSAAGGFGKSEVRALGKDGFGCFCPDAAGGFAWCVTFDGSGRESRGRGAVVLGAERGKDGRDREGGMERPGKGSDDDDELADIGNEGANATNAGTPMSARPNVPAARDPTRRRTVVRGMFPANLLFRTAGDAKASAL